MSRRHRPDAERGFSLIELLVAIAIGLILTVAVSTVMINTTRTQRSSTSVNDINQTGTYAAYLLDRILRSAGSGFAQGWDTAYGCLLNVSQGTTPILPMPAALNVGSAFKAIGPGGANLPFRLAPVVIAKGLATTGGTGGDVLITMSGGGGGGESGSQVTAGTIASGATSIPMVNAIGFLADDLVLLADPAVTAGCLMEQVGAARNARNTSGTILPIGGSYSTAAGATVALTAFGGSTLAFQFGNVGIADPTTRNLPQFQMIGVGSNGTLSSYDLLAPNPSNSLVDVALADNVVEMRALYGITTAATPVSTVDAWVDPVATSASGDYSAATLLDGSAASQAKLRRILAVRIGLVLRSTLAEQDFTQPAGTSLTLFDGTVDAAGGSLKQSRALLPGDANVRFRTFELTIPLRNALLIP